MHYKKAGVTLSDRQDILVAEDFLFDCERRPEF